MIILLTFSLIEFQYFISLKAGGIGSNLARRFFEKGCTLICVDNDKKSLDRLKNDLIDKYSAHFSNEILNKRLFFHVVDIRSSSEVQNFSTNLKKDFKFVDILVK
jgi:NADP-dependent 3-hydroxy acid dehydrogenase YdfG